MIRRCVLAHNYRMPDGHDTMKPSNLTRRPAEVHAAGDTIAPTPSPIPCVDTKKIPFLRLATISAETRYRLLLYLTGCFMFSFGANFFIASRLGTDPLDVLALGLKAHLHITIGIAQSGFAALCLIIWGIWNRKRPPLSPLFTFFFCGSLIDVWMWCRIANQFGLSAYPLLLLGVILCGIGSALIIMSGIGIRAMDLVAITMSRETIPSFLALQGHFGDGAIGVRVAPRGPRWNWNVMLPRGCRLVDSTSDVVRRQMVGTAQLWLGYEHEGYCAIAGADGLWSRGLTLHPSENRRRVERACSV